MSERPQDLEVYRERFLDQLHSSRPDLQSHQQFIQYWKLVERQAQHTEELGQLEQWVRDLSRDRERVHALKERLQARKDNDPAAQALLSIIIQILMLLDDIERKLLGRRGKRRRALAAFLFRAGPGVLKKPKPGDEAAEKPAGAEGEEESKVSEQVLAKPKPPKQPTKKMTR